MPVSSLLLGLAMMMGLTVVSGPANPQDIRQTLHDLRSRLAPEVREESAMCVFCHAPIGARAASAHTPLWQPSAKSNGGFEMYAAPMGNAPSGREIPGASMICLSCHDAAQAPLITDRAGDHPIGVPYAGALGSDVGGVWQPAALDEQARAHRLDVTRGSAARPRIAGRSGFRPPSRSVIDEHVVWWVATSGNSARRTRNDLPLYGTAQTASAPADGVISAPAIECGTCHDPHTTTPMFLRISNAGSRLCLSCHDV